MKAGRSSNGKGHYWTIHPANLEDFSRGDFRRRRAQRRVRRSLGLTVPEEDDEDDDEDELIALGGSRGLRAGQRELLLEYDRPMLPPTATTRLFVPHLPLHRPHETILTPPSSLSPTMPINTSLKRPALALDEADARGTGLIDLSLQR